MQKSLDAFVPPNSIEAEQSTLGSMMLDKRAVWQAVNVVTAGDFYRPAHQQIFDSICAVHDRNEPIDLITVQEELRNRGKLNEVGGTQYLMSLFESVPTASHIKHYAKIVAEQAGKRRLIEAAREIIAAAQQQGSSYIDALQQATTEILNLRGKRDAQMMHLRQAIDLAYEEVQERSRGKNPMSDITTGIPRIDAMTLGIHRGEYTLIGARTSNGKTAKALQIARCSPSVKGVMFCGESGPKALATRQLAARSGVRLNLLRTGSLEDYQWTQLTNASNQLQQIDLWMRWGSMEISGIIASTKMAILEHGIGYIMVDYAQLVRCPGRTKKDQMDFMNQSFKDLASDHNIAVIVLVQLNRGAERGDAYDLESNRPRLSDFKEAGSFEETADLALLLNNPKPAKDDGEPRPAEIIVAKQREGNTGVVKVEWTGACLTFRDPEQYDAPPPEPEPEEFEEIQLPYGSRY
jgi:replicative DNA helicase